MKKKRLAARVILTALITAGFAGWMWMNAPQSPAPQAASSGEATIGGSFTLTDAKGQPFGSESLKGKYSLVFFGFTHCPSICPTALATLTQALNALGDKASAITPVFITVDPERDTPEVMAEYASHFHPSLVALTGTPEQIQAVVKEYKVYASKQATQDDADGYTMDHSGYLYVMDKNGRYVTHFAHDIAPDELAQRLAPYLAKD